MRYLVLTVEIAPLGNAAEGIAGRNARVTSAARPNLWAHSTRAATVTQAFLPEILPERRCVRLEPQARMPALLFLGHYRTRVHDT